MKKSVDKVVSRWYYSQAVRRESDTESRWKPHNNSLWRLFEELGSEKKLQKNLKKVLDKRNFTRYNKQAVTRDANSKQDLENWTKLKLVEPYRGFGNPRKSIPNYK